MEEDVSNLILKFESSKLNFEFPLEKCQLKCWVENQQSATRISQSILSCNGNWCTDFLPMKINFGYEIQTNFANICTQRQIFSSNLIILKTSHKIENNKNAFGWWNEFSPYDILWTFRRHFKSLELHSNKFTLTFNQLLFHGIANSNMKSRIYRKFIWLSHLQVILRFTLHPSICSSQAAEFSCVHSSRFR